MSEVNVFELIKSLGPFPGPVLAALIAGFISFAVTILAKDQKTSEFRQAWIDGLRSDVAEFAGTAIAMASVIRAKQRREEKYSNYLIERHDDFTHMEILLGKICLRLNPKEHAHILELLEPFKAGTPCSPDQLCESAREIVDATQAVLKSEWKRVKKGELSYRLLKWGSFAVFVVIIIFAVVSVGLFQLH